jgi:hypothetical protein
MDTRVEELACIIHERAKESADNIRSAAGCERGDLYPCYRRLQSLAYEMLNVISEYRRDHPEEYVDIKEQQLLARIKELEGDTVTLRRQLHTYREREQTMGRNQA